MCVCVSLIRQTAHPFVAIVANQIHLLRIPIEYHTVSSCCVYQNQNARYLNDGHDILKPTVIADLGNVYRRNHTSVRFVNSIKMNRVTEVAVKYNHQKRAQNQNEQAGEDVLLIGNRLKHHFVKPILFFGQKVIINFRKYYVKVLSLERNFLLS